MWSGADVWAWFAAFPAFVLVIPWQCSLVAPPRDLGPVGPSASTPKQEVPMERVSSAPAAPPPARTVTLPDEVVVKVIDTSQQLFLRCWERAQRKEPGPIANKVRLHLDIDPQGRVMTVQSDSDSAVLSSCLAVVARRLPFPAPGEPAVVDLPLMFR
jgi:hypothetical protein